VPITYTSEEQIEVYRFSIPVTIGVKEKEKNGKK